jgi:uncharacterized repeat protein (TIGR03803 family)
MALHRAGGDLNCRNGIGCGNVFKLDKAGKLTTLHNFTESPDGDYPFFGTLIRGANGDLYGTTGFGGFPNCPQSIGGCGTVFRLTKTGHESLLHRFCAPKDCGTGDGDGFFSAGGLIRDARGNFYGTTVEGGIFNCLGGGDQGCGTVFKLDTSGTETVLYRFSGYGDGAAPYATLLMDANGNLYGTTSYFPGTVFKVTKTGTKTVLHTFSESDGEYPLAGVIVDKKGNLYGTTTYGGESGCGGNGCGTVFSLTKSGTYTVLHSFTGGADGSNPIARLIMDAKGNLYGTASQGGGSGTGCGGLGCGVVFKLTPQ